MTELAELEGRILAALDRIARAAEAQAAAEARAAAEAQATAASQAAAPEGAEEALREALEAERTANAQLAERVRTMKERKEGQIALIERKLARANEQLDVQGFELQRLKRVNAQLAEANRRLIAAQEDGQPDGAGAQRALQAELEALRAERRSEIAELEEIIAELRPLVGDETVGSGTHG